MEPLFESKYERTPKILGEAFRSSLLRSPGLLGTGIFVVLLYGVIILLFRLGHGSLTLKIVLITYAPVVALLLYVKYRGVLRTQTKRDRELCADKGEITVTIRVDDMFIHSLATGGEQICSETKLPFDNLKKGVVTRSLILLQTKANLLYISQGFFHKGHF